MTTCTKIKTFLKLTIARVVFIPVITLASPLIFLMADGTCEDGKKEVKEILSFCWEGFE